MVIETVAGYVFEDTIDGYFPIEESLRQMMQRNNFDRALVRLIHAPAMNIPGLGYRDPVPLRVGNRMCCMIHHMTVLIVVIDHEIGLSGVAQWQWERDIDQQQPLLTSQHRLAEPALVRGLRLFEADKEPVELEGMDSLHTLKLKWSPTSHMIEWGDCLIDESSMEALVTNNDPMLKGSLDHYRINIDKSEIRKVIEIFREV